MNKNTYTDIYNGFVEREENENRSLSQTILPTKKQDKKQSKTKQTEVYTDIYGGYVDVGMEGPSR